MFYDRELIYISECKILHQNILIQLLKHEHRLNENVETRTFLFIVEKLSNKTIIDFNVGRHKDLSTFKSDIQFSIVVSVNYHFFG